MPKLAGQCYSSFKIGFEYRVVEIAASDITAGIDVHRGQSFSLVNNQVTARFQINPSG